MSTYAWIIDIDHLAEPNEFDEAGTCGPHDAPQLLLEALEIDNAGWRFRMFDDDGILYYTGRLAVEGGLEPDETELSAPLDDFGTPNAGAVSIRYIGHPEWDI